MVRVIYVKKDGERASALLPDFSSKQAKAMNLNQDITKEVTKKYDAKYIVRFEACEKGENN